MGDEIAGCRLNFSRSLCGSATCHCLRNIGVYDLGNFHQWAPFRTGMIAFTTFPAPSDNNYEGYGAARHHPGDDTLMDLDEEFESGASKLACPGESLTSAQAFMR
jgi:hypothetical protein